MDNIKEIKDAICDVCHKMWQLGWVAANDGNVTVLLDDDTLLATPTGISKSFITPEKLVRIDREGNILEANEGYRPSSEIKMHLRCYKDRADVRSVLETTCNPFVLSLGDESTSVRRLNFAQAFNPLGSMAGLFLAKYVILAHLNPASLDDRLAMSTEALTAVRDAELFWVCVPYVGLILIAFIIWMFFYRSTLSDRDAGDSMSVGEAIRRLVARPRYAFGVVSQFFYVGVQIAVWTWTIKYVMANMNLVEAEAANYYIYSIFLFIGCRWICTWLMKYIVPAKMMAVFALGGILCCLGTIYLPIETSIYCLVGISGCMSLMFPTIYGIALRGLGPEVKFGAAGLIMAILGGAIITPMMGALVDGGTLSGLVSGFTPEVAAIRTAFYLPVLCFAVVLLYSLAFRNVKD